MNNQRGYSLMELLVVIAIIMIMSTITVINFRETQRRDALRFATDLLKTDLRRIESDAMSGVTYGGSFPAGGYGIRTTINGTEYIVFADNGDFTYNASNDAVITNGAIELPTDVTILDQRIGTAQAQNIDIVVTPPNPDRRVQGIETTDSISFMFKHADIDENCPVVTYLPTVGITTDSVDDNCNFAS